MFLFRAMAAWLEDKPDLSVWFGLLSVLTVAGLMIFINKLNLIDKISYLPALFYILLSGGAPVIHRFNEAVIATILLIFAFTQLMTSFRSERVSYGYFAASILIALATFFFRYACLFMLMVWGCILFFRTGYWREWIFSILGFFLPFFWLFAYCYIIEDNPMRIFGIVGEIFSTSHTIPSVDLSAMIFFAVSFFTGMTTMVYLLRRVNSQKNVVRKGHYMLVMTTLIILLIIFIAPCTLPQVWYLMAFPLSFFLSYYLANTSSIRKGNIILWLFLAGVGIVHYLYFAGQ
ncbi:MAG: hypothetical protein LBR08_08850 [Bacteroidales bacterium]|nr:hypothetical protein [Bacteroidales bacterium]